MTRPTLLTPVLAGGNREAYVGPELIRRALEADPALTGRTGCDGAGVILLSGPRGAAPPASVKERERWELHVRLRLDAEFGPAIADATVLKWIGIADDNNLR